MEDCGFTDTRNMTFKQNIGIKEHTHVPKWWRRLDSVRQYSR